MLQIILFLFMGLLLLILLFINLFLAIRYMVLRKKGKELGKLHKKMKSSLIILMVIFICIFVGGILSQISAYTPKIKDSQGNAVQGSIAELRKVELNGREEWISIRGNSLDNPILLFLAGGPGGSQTAAVRYNLAELEKNFIVVNWDQPGAGKSYNAIDADDISIDTYINDGESLTKYLCSEFGKEKIFLVGESWGSALGIFLAKKDPQNYYAFIGTGQMVDFLETEKVDYNLAIELAKKDNDNKKIEELIKNGEPPYYGNELIGKSSEYLNYLGSYMINNKQIYNSGYQTLRDIGASEYGILDKINYLRGLMEVFGTFYPKLYNVDLRKQYSEIEIPVYFFQGRYDINAPSKLVQDYYDILKASSKELIWFEHSGHSPWINENELFVENLLKIRNQYMGNYNK